MIRNILIITGLLLFLGAGYFFKVSDLMAPDIASEIVVSECDLRQGACPIAIHGNKWQFLISPHNFDVLQPLNISLEKLPENQITLDSVHVQFEGINMDMGYNLVKLQPVSELAFEAKGMLPECTAETMYWLVHLIIVSGDNQTDFQFRLQT